MEPLKRETMSITQRSFLARTAHSKLCAERFKADHNLRILVGHASILDPLLTQRMAAKEKGESDFDDTPRFYQADSGRAPRQVQFADVVAKKPMQDWNSKNGGSPGCDSFYNKDDHDAVTPVSHLPRTPPYQTNISVTQIEVDDDDDLEDEKKDFRHRPRPHIIRRVAQEHQHIGS